MRWSICLILFLFAALFIGPAILLNHPPKLKPTPGSVRAAMEQDLLRDALAPSSPTQFPAN
jgi:hypothetical protein